MHGKNGRTQHMDSTRNPPPPPPPAPPPPPPAALRRNVDVEGTGLAIAMANFGQFRASGLGFKPNFGQAVGKGLRHISRIQHVVLG